MLAPTPTGTRCHCGRVVLNKNSYFGRFMKKSPVNNVLKGLAMGMAEVVPGVSGGTIAFITGIYERLINAIKSISSLPVGVLKREGLKGLWKYIDGNFLLTLGIGMIIGVLIGVFGISYLLEKYPPLIWGFFFGLIIGSAFYIGRQVQTWTFREVIFLIIGITVAYLITIMSPAEGTEHLLFVFIAGAIAISALILPGISGSFILLLMGMYTLILHTVKDMLSHQTPHSVLITSVFILGCLTGLFLFSNVLSWTFKNYRYTTLALLTGFMIGSLNRIWPWRNPSLWLDESSGLQVSILPSTEQTDDFHLLQETNVLPAMYEGNPMIWGTLICTIFGLVIVFLFDRK